MSEEKAPEIEEVPFKSMKITLSEEAIRLLAALRHKGSYRSDSATIEDCIRAIYDVSLDIATEVGSALKGKRSMSIIEIRELTRRISVRISRFIPLDEAKRVFKVEDDSVDR